LQFNRCFAIIAHLHVANAGVVGHFRRLANALELAHRVGIVPLFKQTHSTLPFLNRRLCQQHVFLLLFFFIVHHFASFSKKKRKEKKNEVILFLCFSHGLPHNTSNMEVERMTEIGRGLEVILFLLLQ
jgi:hypothetical protein